MRAASFAGVLVVVIVGWAWLLASPPPTDIPASPTSSAKGQPLPDRPALETPPEPMVATVDQGGSAAPSDRDVAERRSASSDGLVALAALGAGDRVLIDDINDVLVRADRPRLAEDSVVAAADLPALRALAAKSDRRMNEATASWMRTATEVNSKKWQALLAKIRNGEVADLPLRTPNTATRRALPHEAVSDVLYEGQNYIIRTLPEEDEELARQSAALDAETRNRVDTYDTAIRSMFRAPR